MFTGLIEELGSVKEVRDLVDAKVVAFSGDKILNDLQLGDSIAVNGVCLTVKEIGANFFTAHIMQETLARTNFKQLKLNQLVNLERALRLSDRLGGHLLQGHVDTIGEVAGITRLDNSLLIDFKLSADFRPFIVEKGSIAVNGVSLTVVKVDKVGENDCTFRVSLIPVTCEATNLGSLQEGFLVNIEVDVLAKYIQQLLKLN